MDKQTQEAILKWILHHHQHHEGSDRSEAMMDIDEGTMTEFEHIEGTSRCRDGNKPYVNSLELEKFILSLGVRL